MMIAASTPKSLRSLRILAWIAISLLAACEDVCGPGISPPRLDGGLAATCPGETLQASPPAAFSGRLGRTVTAIDTSPASTVSLLCGDIPQRFFDLRVLEPSNQRRDVIAYDFRCDDVDLPCAQPARVVASHETRYTVTSHIQPDNDCASLVDEDGDGRVDENCGLCLIRAERVGRFLVPPPIAADPDTCMNDLIAGCFRTAGLQRWQQYTQDDLGAPPGSWNSAVDCMNQSLGQLFAYQAPETDGDRICDQLDNCPDDPNPSQADFDGDLAGDTCDPDDDDDGVPDLAEVVHGLDPFNIDSDGDTIDDHDEGGEAGTDTDGDGLIDALDDDADDDGLSDQEEAGDDDLATPPRDTDGDGTADFRDLDSDEDGVDDLADNCPLVENPGQGNADGALDGGDACDEDDDDDGLLDEDDNCKSMSNAEQDDADGDGVGDACEPELTFMYPTGDPRIPGEAGPANEFVYSAHDPGELTIPVELELIWDDYDALIDTVDFQIDAIGTSACQLEDQHVGIADGPTRVVTATIRCVGLPADALDFGLKTITARLHRNGAVIGTAPSAQVEIFWPVFIDPNGPPVDANFARNHPESQVVFDPATTGHPPGIIRGAAQWIPASQPNWFHYGIQQPGLLGETYIGLVELHYVQTSPHDDCPQALMPFSYQNGGPNNLVFVTYKVVPSSVLAGQPILRQLHLSIYHESRHVADHIRWTRDGRGSLREPGELGDENDWSWNLEVLSNRWRDLNENGQFDVDILCDLDASLDTSPVYEADIQQSCDLSLVEGLDVNFDQILSSAQAPAAPPVHPSLAPPVGPGRWQILEPRAEDFDLDGDGLPNWEEAEEWDALDRETSADGPTRVFKDQMISMPAQLSTFDWSEGGVNHGP
ncbi:MAG: thrombospondin type 3 repeat-containing protein [bacterium]